MSKKAIEPGGVFGSVDSVDVTYNGPKDERDPSNVFVLPRPGRERALRFRQGVKVSDVPADAVEALKADHVAEAHDFDFSGGSRRTKPDAEAEAKSLGLDTSGTKAQIEARIDEHKERLAEQGEQGGN